MAAAAARQPLPPDAARRGEELEASQLLGGTFSSIAALAGPPLSDHVLQRLRLRVDGAPASTTANVIDDSRLASLAELQFEMLSRCPYWLSVRDASLWSPWLHLRKGQVGVPVGMPFHASGGSCGDSSTSPPVSSQAGDDATVDDSTLMVINAAMIDPDELQEFYAYTKKPAVGSRGKKLGGASPSASIAAHQLYSRGKWTTLVSRKTAQQLDDACQRMGSRDCVWFNLQDVLEATLTPYVSPAQKKAATGGNVAVWLAFPTATQPSAVLQRTLHQLVSSHPKGGWAVAGEGGVDGAAAILEVLHTATTVHYVNLSQLVCF